VKARCVIQFFFSNRSQNYCTIAGLNRAISCMVWGFSSSGELAWRRNRWPPHEYMINSGPPDIEATHQTSSHLTRTKDSLWHTWKQGGRASSLSTVRDVCRRGRNTMHSYGLTPPSGRFSLVVAHLVTNISTTFHYPRHLSLLFYLLEICLLLSCNGSEDKFRLEYCILLGCYEASGGNSGRPIVPIFGDSWLLKMGLAGSS
jgi:hypothetical protein